MIVKNELNLNNLDNLSERRTKFNFESKENKIFPSMVQLMINNTCNLSCSHCPHSTYIMNENYEKKYMAWNLFKKVVDETSNYSNSSIRLFGWGEPLLHPNLSKMVEYINSKNIDSMLITNGVLLNEQISEQLLKNNLSILEVSLDAATPETYEKIRGSKEIFYKVVNNINTFLNLKKKYSANTYVVLSIINQPKASNDIDLFLDQWSSKVDKILVRKFHDFMGSAKDKECITLPERYPCRALWSRFNVTPDGQVSICYNDWESKYLIGDLNSENETIKNIWNSEIYNKYRESHITKNYCGICENCNTWIGSDWKKPYEILLKEHSKKVKK